MSADTDTEVANADTEATDVDVDANQAGTDNDNKESLIAAETQGDQESGSEGGEESTEEGAPEDYELSFGEDAQVNEEMLSEFTTIAKEEKLTQAQAQRFADMGAKLSESLLADQQQQMLALRDSWVAEFKADPDYGGAKFEQSVTEAQRTLQRYGEPSLKDLLNSTGVGDHPAFLRMMARIDRATKEDEIVDGSKPSVKKAPENILYDNMSEEK
jgi:hypothetical protein